MTRGTTLLIRLPPSEDCSMLFVFLAFLMFVMQASPCPPHTTNSTALLTFLEDVQETALMSFGSSEYDPKFFVDLSLKFGVLSETEKAFKDLRRSVNGSVSSSDLKEYIEKYFSEPGSDLDAVRPRDFVPEPIGFLPGVSNPTVRSWALEVHTLWSNLSRRVSNSVLARPESHTLIPLPEPFVIPGSRFKECYYWDSYWVIRGLLASNMYDSAEGIVKNLISLLEKFGHVLNGDRIYYTNRSQPPLLSAMARAVFEKTGDVEFAKTCVSALEREHQFWTTGLHSVRIRDKHGYRHELSRYYAMWNKPRPESSTADRGSAAKLVKDEEKRKFYQEVASAAESGWDFSTRWLRDDSEFTSLATTSVIPVDLNAFVLGMELDIAFLAGAAGDRCVRERFLKLSARRKRAIDSVLWNEDKAQWLDYWLSDTSRCRDEEEEEEWKPGNQNKNAYASNFIPLWIGLYHSDTELVKKVSKSLIDSGLVLHAGIATSLKNSGQQWDFPNGWAPLQQMIVEGLVKSGLGEARTLGKDIAMRWIRTNYAAYQKTGKMHEKYHVKKCGEFGAGGEYAPQTGFGWSNGVVLSFLEQFGWPEHLPIHC